MENKRLEIRKATIKDLNGILRLNFDLFKKEYKEYDKTLNLKWTYTEGKKYFKSRITGKQSFLEIAEYDGKIIGYLVGALKDNPSHRNKERYAELENMMIESALRGQGIGKKMTRNFFVWCKKNNAHLMGVKASIGNKNGIEFYRKLGFKDYDLILEKKI